MQCCQKYVNLKRSLVVYKFIFSRFSLSTRNQTGQEALNRFTAALYNELFGAVVRLLNRRLGEVGSTSSSTITIFDYPGSQFGSFSQVNLNFIFA